MNSEVSYLIGSRFLQKGAGSFKATLKALAIIGNTKQAMLKVAGARIITTIVNLVILLTVMGFTNSCQVPDEKLPVVLEINDGWQFSMAGQEEWLPATVPGTVHSDLLNNGVIEDYRFRMNDIDLQWVEDKDWIYQTTFKIDVSTLSNNRVILNFQGLDTYADVFLNDNLLLEANNMFVGWEVDVKDYIVEGYNTLRVFFHSPVKRGMEKLRMIDYIIPAINEQAPANERTSVFTRKAPFHYGWDWGPRLVTSGIWRPVTLKAWNDAVIDEVYVETRSISHQVAAIAGSAVLEAAIEGLYTLSLSIDGIPNKAFEKSVNLVEGENEVAFEFEIDNPRLWWTNGLGEPHLYKFSFNLQREGYIVYKQELNFGVRTLRLVQEPDSIGRTFYFELNGVPVFMKGANVIPPEILTPLATLERYEEVINNAVKANMNMLRVWGGAIYKDNKFYDLADKNGVLVWQDFMFACNLMPGDEAHLENIRKEATYNVKRLRNHASLALWNGNNENLHGWHNWGWPEMFEPEIRDFMWRTYERIFHEILPEVVAQHDPKSSYWSSSPSSYGNTRADRKSGNEHDWTIWFGQRPFSAYWANVPRFVSEYGMQSFPSMHTIREFSVEGDWYYSSEVMRHRQRGEMPYIEPGFDGNDMVKRYMEKYFRVPERFEDFIYVSQLLQAKGYRTAIEAHRSNMPRNMGTLYWQINDCWPTISWSTVDYFGRWKASHYAVREAYEEIIITAEVDSSETMVRVVSDRLTPVENGVVNFRLLDFKGAEIYAVTKAVEVMANASTFVMSLNMDELSQKGGFDSTFAIIELKSGSEVLANNVIYFATPHELKLPRADVTTSVERVEDGYMVTFSSPVLAMGLFIDIPHLDVFASYNFFDLLPGTPKTIHLATERELDFDTEVRVVTLNNLYD